MIIKCKGCGNSYEGKYNVCPTCGTVRVVLPLHFRVLAIVAAAYLALTLIMLPLGIFSFGRPERDLEAEVKGSGESTPPVVSVTSEVPDTDGTPAEGTPEQETNTPAPGEPTQTANSGEVTLVIYSIEGGDHPKEFTWYIGDGTLKLYVKISPEPVKSEEVKITWKSSDESVFKVDENGVLTPVSKGTETLTAAYGSEASVNIKVVIRDGKLNLTPPNPSPLPEPSPTQGKGAWS